jgi:hypothetical protein
MTKNTKILIILGLGAVGLWIWYRKRQGLSIVPNFAGSGGAPFAGSGSTLPTVGGSVPIDDRDIIALRAAQTGALARTNCIFPNRWINTTSGPYYGKCVQGDVFSEWVKLPASVQGFATDATYAEFMRAIGR